MQEVVFTGGIETGNISASSPTVKMIVTPYDMQINVAIAGTFIFRAADIVSVEEYSALWGLRKGVKINHRVSNYTPDIVFYPSGRTSYILDILQRSIFATPPQTLPADVEARIALMQASGSFPIKKNYAIAIVIIWNLLFIPTIISSYKGSEFDTRFTAFAPGGLAVYCLLLLCIPALQKQLLKPGHQFKNVRSGVLFILLITTFITIIAEVVGLSATGVSKH